MHASVVRVFTLALAALPAFSQESLAAAPRYKMVLGAANAEQGVKTVSLVGNPAIQRGWVALSATQAGQKRIHLGTEGTQKQVLTGPALLPGQEILRLDEAGNPFYITFDAATIEATARQFAAQGRHNSTNQDHALSLSGNVIYESWIVTDPANDKAAALGIDVPAGTWMLSTHIPDSAYWLAEVVSGNKTGFSIEGLFDSEQLTMAAIAAPVPSMNYFQKIYARLSKLDDAKSAEIRLALGMEMLADGRAIQIDDTNGAVMVCDANGIPATVLEDGEYTLANGGNLVVQGGIRQDGEGQGAVAPNPVAAGGAPGTAAPIVPPAMAGAPVLPETLPAAVAPDADPATEGRLSAMEKALNELLAYMKKDEATEAPTTAPAAQKMAAILHGVAVAQLKLDAIELDGGDTLTLNPVSKKLTDSKGALVESGYYKATDGSYFQVSTDQYFWSIDKQTYDTVYGAKLQAVELAQAKTLLASLPGGKAIALGGEAKTDEEAVSPGQLRLAAARAKNLKK